MLRAPDSPPANRIQLTSGTLHVESNGDPLGRLIVCVHGLSANCRLESVDDNVRIRTDLTAVGEDSAYASTRDVYGLWPRLRCPVLLVRASRTMGPGGGLVVSRADAERFAGEARHAAVVDVDADHYSILISAAAISAVERFVGTHAA